MTEAAATTTTRGQRQQQRQTQTQTQMQSSREGASDNGLLRKGGRKRRGGMDCQKDQHESLRSRVTGSRPSCPGVASGLESTAPEGTGHQRRRVWPSLEEVELLVEAVGQTNVMKSLGVALLCPETQVSTPQTPMQVGQ